MLRQGKSGKYRFRVKGGAKCSPSASSKARHAKRFGYSGSKAHKSHHRMLAAARATRLASLRSIIKASGGLKAFRAAGGMQEVKRARRYSSYMKAGGKAGGHMAM